MALRETIPRQSYVNERVLSAKVEPAFHRAVHETTVQKDTNVSSIIKATLLAYMTIEAVSSCCLSA